jgi:hypothetical protein
MFSCIPVPISVPDSSSEDEPDEGKEGTGTGGDSSEGDSVQGDISEADSVDESWEGECIEELGPQGDTEELPELLVPVTVQKRNLKSKGKVQLKKLKFVEENFEIGEFVTAIYEDQWLVAQVDINQDQAGISHVNLSYMERVGDNQFKWPNHHDLLLTLKEDILTRCAPPGLVGSTIRAKYVGLKASDAQAADDALAAVVYLQPFYFQFSLFLISLLFTLTDKGKAGLQSRFKRELIFDTVVDLMIT